MACKELMMCLFLLNEIILTNCQLIQDQQDRCTNNVDKDLLLKLRELQLELSVYRELMEQSIETTRLLQDRLSKVELDYSTFRNESMESELQLKEHIRLLKEEVEEYKNESIHKDLALEDELRKRVTTIGFTAQLTHSKNHYDNTPMIYDAVITNEGSGYSPTTGLFTAPVAGTYVFIVHSMTYHSGLGYCNLYLYRNGSQLQFTVLANSRGRTGGNDSASASAVLTLDTGDTVGIKVASSGYLYGQPWTSFSGFKI